MGLADVVPGVSGGTVALILGIYERLVSAISRVDRRLVGLLRQRRWTEAMEHVNLRFLACLGLGIVGGFAIMTLMLNRLLSNPVTFTLTMACFFGLILASSVLVARLVKPSTKQALRTAILWGLLGAAFAYGVTILPMPRGEATAAPSLLYLFACGALGICAMILPGVSGAMLLLLLGVYTFLTDIPRSLVHGEEVVRNLTSVAVFAAGAVIGLLSFSKVLRWLLVHHHAATMAVLCGFMLGALRKIWPFQHDTTPEIEKFKYKILEACWPDSVGSAILAAVVALAAMLFVFAVDHVTRRSAASAAESTM